MTAPTYFAVDVETTRLAPLPGSLLSVGVVELATGSAFYARDSSAGWWEVQTGTKAHSELFRRLPATADHVAVEQRQEAIDNFNPYALEDWIRQWPGPRIFVASPASFDWGHLDVWFAKAGATMPWLRTLDVRSWVCATTRLPIDCSRDEWPDEVCHVPVIPHHALSDAEALAKTARVLLGIPEPWGVAE
jgi:DNA polymerase III epsilon subunit-like protein